MKRRDLLYTVGGAVFGGFVGTQLPFSLGGNTSALTSSASVELQTDEDACYLHYEVDPAPGERVVVGLQDPENTSRTRAISQEFQDPTTRRRLVVPPKRVTIYAVGLSQGATRVLADDVIGDGCELNGGVRL